MLKGLLGAAAFVASSSSARIFAIGSSVFSASDGGFGSILRRDDIIFGFGGSGGSSLSPSAIVCGADVRSGRSIMREDWSFGGAGCRLLSSARVLPTGAAEGVAS